MTSSTENPNDPPDEPRLKTELPPAGPAQADPSRRGGYVPQAPIPPAIKAKSTREIKAALRTPNLIPDIAIRRAIFEEWTIRVLDNILDPEIMPDPERLMRRLFARAEDHGTRDPSEGSPAPTRPRQRRKRRTPRPTRE